VIDLQSQLLPAAIKKTFAYWLMVAVRTRTLHGGVDQKRETTPVLQNCSVLAVDGIDVRYRVRRKEPEGRVQTHQARRVSGGGDAGVWMR
jgi:hypothetical protein